MPDMYAHQLVNGDPMLIRQAWTVEARMRPDGSEFFPIAENTLTVTDPVSTTVIN